MKNLIGVTALALLTSSAVMAATATTDSASDQITISKSEYDKLSKINDEVSSDNRADKNLLLTAGFGVVSLTAGTGVELGYYINKNSVLSLELHSGKQERERTSSGNVINLVGEYDQTTIGAKFRQFVGNSFNVSGTIHHQVYSAKDRIIRFNDGKVFDGYKRKDIAVGIHIGNKWQWDNFTLGVDWIGISKTVKVLNENRNYEDFDKAEEFGFFDRDGIHASALNLQLGVSF